MSEDNGGTVIRLDPVKVQEFGNRTVRVIEQGEEQSAAVKEDLATIEEQATAKGLEFDPKAWRQAMKLIASGQEKVDKWRNHTEAVAAILDCYGAKT